MQQGLQSQRKDISKKEAIKGYYKDEKIQKLLTEQLQELPLAFKVQVKYQRIYISFKLLECCSMIQQRVNQEHSGLQELGFMIRISKGFPLAPVRLHLVEAYYLPAIYDCRDLIFEVLGEVWNYRMRLSQIVMKLPKFIQKLGWRNQKYLSLQKTGKFQLGETYMMQQLDLFPSIHTFTDQDRGTLLVVTETHFLTLKGRVSKSKSISKNVQGKKVSDIQKVYVLSRCCDLQCIDTVSYCQQTHAVIITIIKYGINRQFGNSQSISRKYTLKQPQLFLRILLKQVPLFQKCQLTLKLPQRSNHILRDKVIQVSQMETRFYSAKSTSEKTELFQSLSKAYQKLIQRYTELSSPYYLIFVQKLNSLYAEESRRRF